MANVVFPEYKDAILTGGTNVSLTGGNIKVVLVDTGQYTYSSTHQFLTDIPAGARVATSPNLTNVTVVDGLLDADNTSISSVTGDTVEACVLYIDTGSEATSRLVLYLDSVTNFPFTPNGGNFNLNWHTNGIAQF